MTSDADIHLRGRHQAVRRDDGGRRPDALDPARRVLRAARPVGLRQDDDAADDRRLRGPDRGPRVPRRRRRHAAAAVQARRQHGVPVVRAVPAPDGGAQRRVRPRAQEDRQVRGPHARRRGARDGPARPVRQAQADAALRRPAAARGARPRAREPAARAAARRAARRARPAPAQAAADPAQAHPAGRRDHVRARHARPGGGHDDGRHDRRDERGPDRAGRRRRRPVRAPEHRVRGELPRRLEPRRRASMRASQNGHSTVETHDGAHAARAERPDRAARHRRGQDRRAAGEGHAVARRRRRRGRPQRAARYRHGRVVPRRLDPVRRPRARAARS